MRILFFTPADISDLSYGGGKGARSRFELLKRLGEVETYELLKKSDYASLQSLIQGHFPPLRNDIIKLILSSINIHNYDVVFVDTSICGTLIRKVKNMYPEVAVLSLFQNCERDYIDIRFKENKGIKRKIYLNLVKKEEGYTLKYSDAVFTLSERDRHRLLELYGREANGLLPLFIKDEIKWDNNIEERDRYCLLFGPDAIANVEGFRWFTQKVSPNIKLKTIVAGRGFEKYREEFESYSNNVTVVGYVDNLSELYRDALCVCIPLFSGGGMKVKTIEAMMYGKSVLGTDEAFSGFDFNMAGVGEICNNEQEYIQSINNLYQKTVKNFNKKARMVYEELYSEKGALELYRKTIEEAIYKTKRKNR